MATPTTTTMVAVAIIVVVSTISASHCKAASLNPNLGNETATTATSSTRCNSLDKECLIGVEDEDIENSAFPSLYRPIRAGIRTGNPKQSVCDRDFVERYGDIRCLGTRSSQPKEKCGLYKRSC
uniref:Uncharacterized protein n=1 Tax=Cucumis melo TaxID=3656 RepID=A0A9I9DKL1_CUCME